jgi:tripartite-type tricarboxylate transporter receptor subunit TctC
MKPEEFDAYVKDEIKVMAEIVKASGIQPQ